MTAYPADPDADAVADPGGTPLPHPDCEIFPTPVSWSHLMDLHVGEAGAWEDLRVLVRQVADAREGLRPWESGGAPPMQKLIIRGSATVELLVCVRGEGVRRVTLDLSSPSDPSDPSLVVEPYRIIPLRLVPVRTRQLGMHGEPGELSGTFPEEASIVRLCIQRIDLPQPCLDATTPRD